MTRDDFSMVAGIIQMQAFGPLDGIPFLESNLDRDGRIEVLLGIDTISVDCDLKTAKLAVGEWFESVAVQLADAAKRLMEGPHVSRSEWQRASDAQLSELDDALQFDAMTATPAAAGTSLQA